MAGLWGMEALLAPSTVYVTYWETKVSAECEYSAVRAGLEAGEDLAPLADGCAVARNGTGDLVLLTGVGSVAAGQGLWSLALDPRFDLRRAAVVLAGVAGVNPRAGTIGSVFAARWVVDGDRAHDIDPRELDGDPLVGTFPLGLDGPQGALAEQTLADVMFPFAAEADDDAWKATCDALATISADPGDHRDLDHVRGLYPAGTPAAQPAVYGLGDNLAANRFWHGDRFNRWAEDWVAWRTRGQGRFVTSAMEDAAVIEALQRLARHGRMRADRWAVLRAGSNFTAPPPGVSALDSLHGRFRGPLQPGSAHGFPSLRLALDNLGRAAPVVGRALAALP